jgi:hypothetical protein
MQCGHPARSESPAVFNQSHAEPQYINEASILDRATSCNIHSLPTQTSEHLIRNKPKPVT